MKRFFLTLALIVVASTLTASAQKFTKGTNYATASVGVGNYGIPISLQYERGVYDINEDMAIGVGGYLGTSFFNNSAQYAISASGAYHYTGFESWDLYGALRLGFKHYAWNSTSGLSLGFNAGARYFFNSNWAAMAEVGYGISYLNIGVTYAF